jgi:hypothetical protein
MYILNKFHLLLQKYLGYYNFNVVVHFFNFFAFLRRVNYVSNMENIKSLNSLDIEVEIILEHDSKGASTNFLMK